MNAKASHRQRVANRWIACRSSRPEARYRVFCFPYAGGSDVIYRQWDEQLPEQFAVYPVQLPGRGWRISEPAFTSVPHLVANMAPELRPYLNKPFVLFGHS